MFKLMRCRIRNLFELKDPDSFYNMKLGIFYLRNKYRYPASKWFFTLGRFVMRKWWVPSPISE